jgi:hypothetical protein
LLKILKVKNPQKADSLIKKVIRSFGDYTTDPEIYRKVRKEILQELDACAN